MPLPTTRVIHPDWSEHNANVNDDPSAVNAVIQILNGTSTDWNSTDGVVPGTGTELYSGPARVSYDLDRPFTKDNADQVTSTSIVLVQLPRTAQVRVYPGNTVNVISVDKNGLQGLAGISARVLSQRRSGLSWGATFDCVEMVGRKDG
jgi:hypothetical protein